MEWSTLLNRFYTIIDMLTMRTLMMNMKTLEVLKTLKLLLLTGKMTLSMTMSRIWTSSSSLS